MPPTQPLLDAFLRKIGAGRQHALISFRVSCEFPLAGGHVFTFVPLPLATAGAVPVGVPIQSIVLGGIANDRDFLALVVANGPDQPPGSPTVVIDYHIAIWTANT